MAEASTSASRELSLAEPVSTEDEGFEELPYWPPSPAAIAAAAFGVTDFGPIEPTDKDAIAMTESIAGFLLATLEAIDAISNPSLLPRANLHAWGLDGIRLDQNLRNQFERRCAAHLSQFADGFGEAAAQELDA